MSELQTLLKDAQGPAGRRLLLFALAAAAIVTVWIVAHQMTTPTYMTLFRDLDLKEAGQIGDQLRKNNIEYKLTTGGTEIQVPVAQVATARVALAREGLPSSGRPGLELFDKASWGMTDFTQRVTYQRALEGELARTIGGLDGIQGAQVHLVLPTASNLRRNERPASASVVLTLKNGGTLSNEAVQGIVYIVANSVEQLPSENVAVMDATGHVLSVPAGPGAGGGSRNLELQRTLESQLTTRIEDLLATVVGPGRVRAQVAATLSFDQVERTNESYDPDGQVLANEQRSETGDAEGNGAQTIVNNSYQNTHKVERSVSASGAVTRLTVAVLVDQTALGAAKNVTVDQLREMARDAAGVDSTRGDRLTLNAVAFEPVAVPEGTGPTPATKAAPDVMGMVDKFGRPLLAVVAIVALLILALRVLKSPARPAGEPVAAAAGGATPAAATDTQDLALLRQRLLAEPGPDATTQVLRAWLADNK